MSASLTPARADVVRSAATLAFAAAQPVAGYALTALGRGKSIGERAHEADTPATPADGAFAIWGPIFAANLNYALRAVARRDQPLIRRTGWLAAAAFAGNTAWELWAQARGIGWRSVALILPGTVAANAAMLTAARAEADEPSRGLVLGAMAPLAGWLTVAAAVDVASARVKESKATDAAAKTGAALAAIGGASAAASALAYASRGNVLFAGAAGWGLAGTALRNARERNRPVALAALAGLAAVGAATLLARRA